MINKLPPSLASQPQLDMWLSFDEPGLLLLRPGKVEIGQGIKTALAMICAEELDLSIEQVRVAFVDTDHSPNEFVTAGSMSVEMSGSAVRQVSADARAFLMQLASAQLDCPMDELLVSEGMVSHPHSNVRVSYWELMAGKRFDIDAQGNGIPRSADKLTVVGRSVARLDLRGKFTGARAFIQDQQIEGLLHARIIRPPAIGATLLTSVLKLQAHIQAPVQLVVDGSFIGVVAASELEVIGASERLAREVQWDMSSVKPIPADIHSFLEAHAAVSLSVVEGMPVEGSVPAFLSHESAAVTHEARYLKPFHMHGSVGPSAAIAEWTTDRLTVWSHSQGPFVLRSAIAQALDLEIERVRVIHRENAGCYGHNGADDAAFEAALLARAVPGSPILLKWTRSDEHSSEPLSPAMVMRLKADLDAQGRVLNWNHDVFSNSHMGRPAPFGSVSNFVSAWLLEVPRPRPEPRPGMAPHGGIHRNADPYYSFPERRIVKHLVKKNPVRTSSTRGLGAYGNVFAIESFMDELAALAGQTPVQFRKAHLTDPRAIAVIDGAIESFNKVALADRYQGSGAEHKVFGQGLAFARYKNIQTYAAVMMGLCVDIRTFEVSLIHAAICADAGRVIDRDGLVNQLEGGLIQSASWTLKEEVKFSEFAVTSRDWVQYPILTFAEVPTVDVRILDDPAQRPLGAGEATQGPTAAAIANAIAAATGLRPRQVPFTSSYLRHLSLAD